MFNRFAFFPTNHAYNHANDTTLCHSRRTSSCCRMRRSIATRAFYAWRAETWQDVRESLTNQIAELSEDKEVCARLDCVLNLILGCGCSLLHSVRPFNLCLCLSWLWFIVTFFECALHPFFRYYSLHVPSGLNYPSISSPLNAALVL